jgi:hypothetical protein
MVEIEFPDWPRRRLERVAVEHAVEVALAYDRVPGDAPADRLVVNLLRHEFTSCDAAPARENHRAACEAIATRFLWLRDECERQVQARERQEAGQRAAMDWAEATLAAGQAERKARSEEPGQAIRRFHEGMTVTAKVKGHVREATVVKVGRTRLTIGFKIKTGASRTAVVCARDAQPA